MADPKRPKRPRDINQLAYQIVKEATSDAMDGAVPALVGTEKNQAAVTLGRLGASKGGHARATKLTAGERKRIAVEAAKARWKKEKDKP